MSHASPKLYAIAAVVAGGLVCNAAAARAAPEYATDWAPGMKSRSRIIAAGGGDGGAYLAGVQIELSPRTVTYWRTPGDAGTPPVVSFEGSKNLAGVRFEFPAPKRIDEDGIEALGYLDEVVFPLRIQAKNPAEPVALHVKLDYAACEKICVPVHAESDLVLPSGVGAGPYAARLAAAEAAVPVKQTRGQRTAPSIAAVRGLTGDWAAGQGRFQVEARVPGGGTPVTLFAEGPSGWYLQPQPAPAPVDGLVTILVKILQAPSGARIAETPFTLTLVAGERAVEVPVHLDNKDGAF